MIAQTEFKEIKMTNNWADIMEEEDQQVYYQGWIKTEN